MKAMYPHTMKEDIPLLSKRRFDPQIIPIAQFLMLLLIYQIIPISSLYMN